MTAQPNRSPDAELLTPGAVAAVLLVDPRTVTRWARAGRLDSIRTPGGHRRYRRSDIEALRDGEASLRPRSASVPEMAALQATEPASDRPGRPEPQLQVVASDPPWDAAEVADAVAVAFELEAEAALDGVRLAQGQLETASATAREATARARQARARADAESAHLGTFERTVTVPNQRPHVRSPLP